jgi:hypothetical protein
MVVTAQNLEKAYEEGRISLEFFQAEYAKVMSQMGKFEKKITNVSSMKNMKKSMDSTFEEISGLMEQYLTLGATDVEGKMEVVAEAVAQFGI